MVRWATIILFFDFSHVSRFWLLGVFLTLPHGKPEIQILLFFFPAVYLEYTTKSGISRTGYSTALERNSCYLNIFRSFDYLSSHCRTKVLPDFYIVIPRGSLLVLTLLMERPIGPFLVLDRALRRMRTNGKKKPLCSLFASCILPGANNEQGVSVS